MLAGEDARLARPSRAPFTRHPTPTPRMPTRKRTSTLTPDELRELARAMGCRTQKALAEQLGITQPRVSQILTGAYPIRPGPLLTLVRELQSQYVHGRKVRA